MTDNQAYLQYIHECIEYILDIIWDIVEQDLPTLQGKVEEILRDLGEE